jgi:tyrosinase
MGVRRNILTSTQARDQYIKGAKLLKAELLGPTTTDMGVPGPSQKVNTWDLFVIWHHTAMNRFTPPSQSDRNAAHRGPVFLPWHRFMLILLELQFQRVLKDTTFGLPYWDWAADGDKTPQQQLASAIWGPNVMGGQGSPVTTGPFAFAASNPASWRVRVDVDVQGNLRQVNRGLRREFAVSTGTLPRKSDVASAVALPVYDQSPWSTTSAGFRNRLEGWQPTAPQPPGGVQSAPGLHNRIHVWIGGDMLPSSSPNDPAFYLNHCNVDRIWAAQQAKPQSPPYAPTNAESASLLGHRLDDQMYALLSSPQTPKQMLNVTQYYTYDSLVVS